MIDLDATGPVYRGHKLARIVSEYDTGFIEGFTYGGNDPVHWSRKPVSTKAWARLDVRVIGNIWGLSVSDLPHEGYEAWEAMRGYVD